MKLQNAIIEKNFKTTFTSITKDQETIWKKLFVESRPYSDKLKRLLVINTPDCFDESQYQYTKTINSYSIKKLKDEKYIQVVPRLPLEGYPETKSYIILEFDNVFPSGNPEFTNKTISFDIICNLDQWELEDSQIRPWVIAGYIDGILNHSRLSGIGLLELMGAEQVVFSEDLGGVILRYTATNGREDDEVENPQIPADTYVAQSA